MMFEYLIACGVVAGIPLAIAAAYKVGEYVAKHQPMPDPQIDMDLFEAEMAMEAAVLEERLSSNRRLEMAARLVG